MLGDISFKLETKLDDKKYNQDNSSVVNNMQYNLFTISPLHSLDLFLLISSRISDFKCHSYKIPLCNIN
jgi:hypothetical protein